MEIVLECDMFSFFLSNTKVVMGATLGSFTSLKITFTLEMASQVA